LLCKAFVERTQGDAAAARLVDPVSTAVLLLHPIAALTLIWIFVRQRRWRQQNLLLRGAERAAALESHQTTGDRMMAAVIGVIALAFGAHIARASLDGLKVTAYLVPGHFHGWAGLLGLLFMITLWRVGRKTRDLKSEGKSFAQSKEFHGRISDVMMMLVTIHAFLGFIYLLKIM
jgi:hypothetical protein